MRVRFVLVLVSMLAAGCEGRHEEPGEPAGAALPGEVVAARGERQQAARARLTGDGFGKQILFGDLHAHTTFSIDAFALSLPIMYGVGAHPPADACDFARYCADLDFWSINDHAEGLTPRHWQETKAAIRQCNAVAGDPRNPDVVAFLGWEWSQVGATPADHYGHQNVILRDTADDQVPARPIAAPPLILLAFQDQRPMWQRLAIPLFDFPNRQRYFDYDRYQREVREVPRCPEGVDSRMLPPDCHEVARDPRELFEKLSQSGAEAIVIPHGTTWGLYTPPGSSLDLHLAAGQHDPQKQRLIEVYSGHGNSEEYRGWRAVAYDADGRAVCPEPTADYLPCCWQAGELIRARCGDAPPEVCERRVAEARQRHVDAGLSGHVTVPGASLADWLDCGQCRDCFNPAFNFRPASSVQYGLAIANFDDPQHPRRLRFGFIASSDNHRARPGTGYKEYARHLMTEAAGARSAAWRRLLLGREARPAPESVALDASAVPVLQLYEGERQASFFMTGGLVAAHAAGRDRDAIWAALKRREVYGTSGERILLWFDLLNGPQGPLPMGSETALAANPVFRVRAVGSFKQLPGCPPHAVSGLAPARLESLCRGECYNPSDERHRITRIEVVRVRSQQRPGEPVDALIEDPWRRLACPPDPAGCQVEFDDPDFLGGGREAVYYVRALQEPTLAVNAGNLRARYDEAGQCVAVDPCYGDYRTPPDDDCLSLNEERAWSSPIYVQPER